MKRRTYKALGITWVYWLMVAGFFAFSSGAFWAAVRGDTQEDRRAGLTAGIMFAGISITFFLWPFLRKREREGVQTETIRTAELYCEAILIPASRVKRVIFLIGACFMGSGALGILFQTDSLEYRVKGGIAVIMYAVIMSWGIRDCFLPRHGIVLLPQGLIWREMFRTPFMIPWDAVSEVMIFAKKEQYSTPRSLGIIVSNTDLVQTTKGQRKKLVENYARFGAHFDFSTETLLLPLDLAAAAIDFYRRNPESRREIGTATALKRIEDLEKQLDSTYKALGVSNGLR